MEILSLWSLPPHPPSHPPRSSQSPELSPPDNRAASHLLSSLHMVVHICHRSSLNASHPLRPPHFHKSVLCIRISTPSLKTRTSVPFLWDFHGGSDGQESARNAGDPASIPESGRSPGERSWQPTPVLFRGESHGGRILAGYSPWGSQRVGHEWATNAGTIFLDPTYTC